MRRQVRKVWAVREATQNKKGKGREAMELHFGSVFFAGYKNNGKMKRLRRLDNWTTSTTTDDQDDANKKTPQIHR